MTRKYKIYKPYIITLLLCFLQVAGIDVYAQDPVKVTTHDSVTVREAPKAQGQDRIYTHGEKEHESVAKVKAEGIPVLNGTMLEVQDLCNELGLDFKSYFGDYVPEAPATMFKGNY